MIPKKLQIKNFLSYGSDLQSIEFLSYNLICLSGKNGHGKSALLDSITWALWGQARKTNGTSKADEGLVHLGQKHMLVVFDFEINNINYRVRREFVKTASHPFSALDFGIVKDDDSFTTLTDKTIRATQAKLEKTIGITYESFINSAFLRQGQANEFSKKSPKERKDILATILQLERFEDLKKIALEKGKEFQVKLLTKQSINDRITHEILELKELLKSVHDNEKQLLVVQEQEKKLQADLRADDEKKELLLVEHKKYEFVQLQKIEQQKQLNEIESRINAFQKIYQEIALQQTDIANIKIVEEEQKKLRTTMSTHQEKLNKRLELKDQYLTLQEQKQKVEKELSQEKSEIIQKYEIAYKILQEQIQQHQRDIVKHTNQLQAHTTQITKLTKEISNISHQNCPLCEQNLSTEHKKIVYGKLKFQADQEEKQIASSQKQLDELEKQAQLNIDHQKKSEATPFNPEKQAILIELITKIDQLKETGQNLAYNKELHQKDFKTLQEVEVKLASYQNLQKEVAQQEQRIKQISDLKTDQLKMIQSYGILDKDLQEMKDCPAQLVTHLVKLQESKQLLEALMTQKSDLLNKKTVFDLQHKKVTTLQQEIILIEKELKSINAEIVDFAEIGKALGKDGLQALLIEQALPEIEQEANILLAQLTDNQTQIYIESLRDLKKGGSKETLDIKISDSIGLRPYEMFSGGEAFRIDFALRIAISKLLARRSGTALQTLIIDEGFGSQDDDGLQLIMDSILKIQDNFAKVIIVSHLATMKDQFPVQFLVEKKASGSVITVIEQG